MAKIDPDNTKFYRCDHTKNTSCSKTGCFYVKVLGTCKYTTNPEYSLDGIAYSANELVEYENSCEVKAKE